MYSRVEQIDLFSVQRVAIRRNFVGVSSPNCFKNRLKKDVNVEKIASRGNFIICAVNCIASHLGVVMNPQDCPNHCKGVSVKHYFVQQNPVIRRIENRKNNFHFHQSNK